MKSDKKRNLQQAYALYTRIPALILGVAIGLAILFASLYVAFKAFAFVIVLIVLVSLAFIAYVVFYIYLSRRLNHTFYKQIYETTYKNLNKIKENDTSLLSYGNSDIQEVKLLDEATLDIKKKLASSYLIVNSPDYSPLKLEYVDKERDLITFKSFKENLSNIIFVSQTFRNVSTYQFIVF